MTLGPLQEAELRVRAELYASTLKEGSEIHGYDAVFIGPFAAYLGEALLNAGLTAEVRIDHGHRITVIHEGKGE